MSDTIMTPEFRVSFPNLFRARKANEQAEPKYNTMCFIKVV